MATVLSATPGLLKIANLAGTETFLALVATTQPAQRQAQLLTQLKLLVDARIPGGERLEILEALRNTALETQRTRSREYWGQPVPFDNDTREIFERSVALWRVLADAYESLIADMAGSAPDLAEHADLLRLPQARVLDYGCGSGILAIGAALHGATDVYAVDIDPAAVQATAANAQANGVGVRSGLPDQTEGSYSVVLANILATPLQLLAPLLCAHLRPGAQLVLAGILERQADLLKTAYAPWLALQVSDAQEGWILMTGQRPRNP